MKCRVKITQTLEGYVDLEVSNPDEALTLADNMYRLQGMELPDMDDCCPLQFSLEEVLEQDGPGRDKVFLIPGTDNYWSAEISNLPPNDRAVELVAEGDYPADIYYERLDLNGSGVVDGYICHDRKELLQTLNWIGACGHTPLTIWDFDIDKPLSEGLCQLLQDTYEQKCKRIQALDWDQEETLEVAEKGLGLQEKLSTAKEMAKQAPEQKVSQNCGLER